jgi:prophage regulatory protein
MQQCHHGKSINMSQENKRILRLLAALTLLGLSKSTVYAKLNPAHKNHDATFPKPIKLGARGIGFIESELQGWIDSRISARG